MGLVARAAETPNPYVVPPSKQFDGNDGYWSTFTVSVGTPGQEFRVLPSTKGGITYAIAPEGCLKGVDPVDCPRQRGVGIFQSVQNIGYQVNVSTSWSAIGQYDVDLERSLNYTSQGLFGFDSVALGPAAESRSLSLSHQVVAGVADPGYFLGVLPLGQATSGFSGLNQPVEPLLYQLRNSSKIPSYSYAYTAGAKYRLKSVFGSLILGGFDSTRFKANANDFSFSFSADPSKLLTVSVASIMGTNTLKGSFSMTTAAHFSVIDSTVSHLWLPREVCNKFETAFGLTYDPRTDLYLVNDTIHDQLLSQNPSVTLKLANSAQDSTTNYTNIQLPYAAFDLQASYPFYPNATRYFPIRRAANDSQYVLGRTLLQEAYLTVDYERGSFKVAQAAFPDPLPAANVMAIMPPKSTPKASTSSGISTGAIVGIALAAVAIVVLFILGFLCRRKRRASEKKHELGGKEVSESDHTLSSPLKSPGIHEVSGTPLTELASPHQEDGRFPRDQKTVITMNDTPQELHAESRTPSAPRWQEVTLPPPTYPRETDRESIASHDVSNMPTDDGYGTGESGLRSGVSPMTPRYHQY